MPENIPLPFAVQRLKSTDVPPCGLNAVFGEVFDDPDSYGAETPEASYLAAALDKEHVIALAAFAGGQVVGGLVAYELEKLERACREIYIYDLAVTASRCLSSTQGIATALIENLRDIARERGAWVVYVQADYGDAPAIALYEKLGVHEEVLHFDIPIVPRAT